MTRLIGEIRKLWIEWSRDPGAPNWDYHLDPMGRHSTFDFDELEREERLRSGDSETEKRALNNLALVTENVSRIEVKRSRKTAAIEDEPEGPPGLVESEVSENEECPDKEVPSSEEKCLKQIRFFRPD